jgi:pimeloyl-ACP methyl ester carboxylesterase
MGLPEYAMKSTSRGITYTQRGVGPAMILVHGWCLNRTLWTYHEESLASSGYHVISPDLPGFVGFAFGAAVAMALAARDGSRIAGLVLIGVPSAGHAPYDRMPRAMRRDWPDFAWKSARAICKQPQSEATLDWLSGMFRATPLPVALETVALLAGFEPVPIAGRVVIETLLVHGKDDDVVPVAISEACAEQMVRGTLEVVGECGHLVILDQQQRLSEILRAFATRVTA